MFNSYTVFGILVHIIYISAPWFWRQKHECWASGQFWGAQHVQEAASGSMSLTWRCVGVHGGLHDQGPAFGRHRHRHLPLFVFGQSCLDSFRVDVWNGESSVSAQLRSQRPSCTLLSLPAAQFIHLLKLTNRWVGEEKKSVFTVPVKTLKFIQTFFILIL